MKIIILIIFIFSNIQLTTAKVVKTPDVDTELISEFTAIIAGSEFWAGIRLKMKNKCHIYWTNPGDVGIPTKIKINLPDGFPPAKVFFPVPKLSIETGIASLIYEDEIIVPIKIYVPESFNSKDFSIYANVEWLACKEICTADSAKASLVIKIGNKSKINNKWAKIIENAVNSLPIQTESLAPKAIRNENSILLTFNSDILTKNGSVKKVLFFPYEQGIYELAEEQIFAISSNKATVDIPLSNLKVKEPENLFGIIKLVKDDDKEQIAYEINVPIINNYKELK